MVEGPGCALHAEELRARVRRGQAVRSARGSALPAAGSRAVRSWARAEARRGWAGPRGRKQPLPLRSGAGLGDAVSDVPSVHSGERRRLGEEQMNRVSLWGTAPSGLSAGRIELERLWPHSPPRLPPPGGGEERTRGSCALQC